MVAGQGITFVEFDVQPTRDGVPVIYHDFWVERNKACLLPIVLDERRLTRVAAAAASAGLRDDPGRVHVAA
jgi:glycerophosphoryl diester phosphodiesterase